MRRFFKVKNFFLISFLAVAGIFSYAAVAIDKQVNESPVVEKAEAATVGSIIVITPVVREAKIIFILTALNSLEDGEDVSVLITPLMEGLNLMFQMLIN